MKNGLHIYRMHYYYTQFYGFRKQNKGGMGKNLFKSITVGYFFIKSILTFS